MQVAPLIVAQFVVAYSPGQIQGSNEGSCAQQKWSKTRGKLKVLNIYIPGLGTAREGVVKQPCDHSAESVRKDCIITRKTIVVCAYATGSRSSTYSGKKSVIHPPRNRGKLKYFVKDSFQGVVLGVVDLSVFNILSPKHTKIEGSNRRIKMLKSSTTLA